MTSQAARFLEFEGFCFDTRDRRLTRDGRLVALTPKACDLLLALLHGRGDIVSKDDLLRTVWTDTIVEEGNLAFHIHAIRDALRESGGNGRQFIENVPRRGYRFAVPVAEVADISLPRTGGPAVGSAERVLAASAGMAPSPVRRVLVPAAVATALATAVVAVGSEVALRRRQPEGLRVSRYDLVPSDTRNKDVDGPIVTDESFVYFRKVQTRCPAPCRSQGGSRDWSMKEASRFSDSGCGSRAGVPPAGPGQARTKRSALGEDFVRAGCQRSERSCARQQRGRRTDARSLSRRTPLCMWQALTEPGPDALRPLTECLSGHAGHPTAACFVLHSVESSTTRLNRASGKCLRMAPQYRADFRLPSAPPTSVAVRGCLMESDSCTRRLSKGEAISGCLRRVRIGSAALPRRPRP